MEVDHVVFWNTILLEKPQMYTLIVGSVNPKVASQLTQALHPGKNDELYRDGLKFHIAKNMSKCGSSAPEAEIFKAPRMPPAQKTLGIEIYTYDNLTNSRLTSVTTCTLSFVYHLGGSIYLSRNE